MLSFANNAALSANAKAGLKQALADPKGALPADCPLPEAKYFDQKRRVSNICFDKPKDMIEWYPAPMMGAEAIG